MTVTTTSVDSATGLLEEACSRNTPAELHYDGAKGSVIVGRVRILELTEDFLLADRPRYADGQEGIPRHKKISVHILINGTRYQFDSAIEKEHLVVRLNAQKRVQGIALQKPTSVKQSQRRENHRLSVVSFDPIRVVLAQSNPDLPGTCELDAKRFKAKLADISVGGVSLLVERSELATVSVGDAYFICFALPLDTGDFQMLARVQHGRKIEVTGAYRVGFSFRPWRGRQDESEQIRLSQALATLQRHALQRRR